MPAPSPPPSHLYKILSPPPPNLPQDIPSHEALPGTALDAADGFIHLSTRGQVSGVLSRFFQGPEHAEILLVKIHHAKLADFARARTGAELKWEEAKSGVFAHLYGEQLRGEVIVGWRVVRRGEGGFGEGLERLETEGWFVD